MGNVRGCQLLLIAALFVITSCSSDSAVDEPTTSVATTENFKATTSAAGTSGASGVVLDIFVSDWTESVPPGDRFEIWVEGSGSWFPDLERRIDSRYFSAYPVGQPGEFFVYPDGRDGTELRVEFVMTSDMISGSYRATTYVQVWDGHVLVWGEAIPDFERQFDR